MSRRASPAVGLMLPLIAMTAVTADVVERRGTAASITGEVTMISDDGVTLRPEVGAETLVPWDQVRRVRMSRYEPSLDERMRTATDLWRARTRVQRGDFTLAEPLLERLFETYRGRTHGTARLVAEGLLRCRLARGANDLAVIPALEVARLDRAGFAPKKEGDEDPPLPIVDEVTSLCPQLAPAWVGSRALRKLERDLAEYQPGGDAVVDDLRTLYLAAVRRHVGTMSAAAKPDPALARSAHPGVALLARVVACEAVDVETRAAARDQLLRELDEASRWPDAWSRFAIGSSLLRESGLGRQQQGMVHLLHVPARYRSSLPYLAGLSVARVADANRRTGDSTAATVLDEELQRSYPGHPLVARRPTAPLP